MEAISAQWCGVCSAPNAHDGGASDTLTDRGSRVKVLQEHDLVAVSSAGLQPVLQMPFQADMAERAADSTVNFTFAHTSTSNFDQLFQAMQPGR